MIIQGHFMHYCVDNSLKIDTCVLISLTRIDPSQNMQRFYCLSVQPDLFGGYSLVREWGRIGRSGQLLHKHYPDEPSAQKAAEKMLQIKKNKGYQYL